MFVTGTALAIALAVVAGTAAWWARSATLSRGWLFAAMAAAVWVTAMGVVWLRHDEPRARPELVQSLDSLAWPGTRNPVPAPVSPSSPAAGTGIQAASVESLVGGLEARLAARPDDAEGWALLAQSYAYTANEEALERAVRRAVELGVDEQSLRERVTTAKRSAHSADWVEQAIGTRRP